jgi:hypothetical protein
MLKYIFKEGKMKKEIEAIRVVDLFPLYGKR